MTQVHFATNIMVNLNISNHHYDDNHDFRLENDDGSQNNNGNVNSHIGNKGN